MRSIDGVKKFHTTTAIPTQMRPCGSIIEAIWRSLPLRPLCSNRL